ncbi:hypothetical protein Tco_0748458 [Tanacetum coccineum]|uniref:Uncharacterized protein n=1 Tax=Tanacetum coccineum TaxID=301880 RepID=A0ABQ4YWH1_9ASTR
MGSKLECPSWDWSEDLTEGWTGCRTFVIKKGALGSFCPSGIGFTTEEVGIGGSVPDPEVEAAALALTCVKIVLGDTVAGAGVWKQKKLGSSCIRATASDISISSGTSGENSLGGRVVLTLGQQTALLVFDEPWTLLSHDFKPYSRGFCPKVSTCCGVQ